MTVIEERRESDFKKKYGITEVFYRGFHVNSWSWDSAKYCNNHSRETYWTEGRIIEKDIPVGDHSSHRHILEDCSWIIVEDNRGTSFYTSLEDMQEIEDSLAGSKAVKQYLQHIELKKHLGIKRLMYFENEDYIKVQITDNEYPLDVWDVHDLASDAMVSIFKDNEDFFENTTTISTSGSFLSFYVGEDRFVCSKSRDLSLLEENLLESKDTLVIAGAVSFLNGKNEAGTESKTNSKKKPSFSRTEIMKIRALKTKYNISEIHWQKDINDMVYTVNSNKYYNYWSDGKLIEGGPVHPKTVYLALKDAKWVIFEGKDGTYLYTVVKDYSSLEKLLSNSEEAKDYLAHLEFKKRFGISRLEYYKKGTLFQIRIDSGEYKSDEVSKFYSDGTIFYRFATERENAHYVSMVEGTWFMFSIGEIKILCTEIRDLKEMERIISEAKETIPRLDI